MDLKLKTLELERTRIAEALFRHKKGGQCIQADINDLRVIAEAIKETREEKFETLG